MLVPLKTQHLQLLAPLHPRVPLNRAGTDWADFAECHQTPSCWHFVSQRACGRSRNKMPPSCRPRAPQQRHGGGTAASVAQHGRCLRHGGPGVAGPASPRQPRCRRARGARTAFPAGYASLFPQPPGEEPCAKASEHAHRLSPPFGAPRKQLQPLKRQG